MKSEIDRVREFQQGYEKGFEYFYNKLYKRLLLFSIKITRDQCVAEEIVSEAFVKLWQMRDKTQNYAGIKNFLFTDVRNQSLSALTSRTNRFKRNEKYTSSEEVISESIEHSIIRAEVYRELYEQVDNLPEKCKNIFTLMYKQGLPAKDISRVLNISKSTIKTQKARGILLIRSLLTKESPIAEIKTT